MYTREMRALILSGGGALGAFQVGVIKKLTQRGHTWNVFSGVSVGALNAAHMAAFPVRTQMAGAMTLESFWRELKGSDSVYTPRPLGVVSAVFKTSVNDTVPLRQLVQRGFSKKFLKDSGNRLRLGAVSLNTGRYRSVTENDDRIPDWIMASAAFPLAFPPVEIDGQLWVDGGVRNVTPFNEVLSMPDVTEADVIITSPMTGDVAPWTVKNPNGLDVAARCASLLADEVYVSDIRELANARIPVRLWAPRSGWMADPLDFNPTQIAARIEAGLVVGAGEPVILGGT